MNQINLRIEGDHENEVLSRYKEKSSNLRDITDAWIEKHIESVPLHTKE